MKKIFAILAFLMFISGTSAYSFTAEYKILDKINEPKDVKQLSLSRMNTLAKDLRIGILNRTNTIGGHVGSDLGVVEATIALHYVFDSPVDKFIFDTSHQCYPHKMLTGRKNAFIAPLEHPEITGFSNFKESPHDFFIMGHTSTSISLATGMAKARDLKGEKYNIVALIGDGSLSGGEALEGLNNASVLGSNIIIIVNDNEMCIAENHGGLYKNLKELRESKGFAQNNMFKALGFDYYYVEKGNDIKSLIEAFQKVKDTNKPTIVHIHTIKGNGYKPAIENKEKFHYMHEVGYIDKKPFIIPVDQESYNSITKDFLLDLKNKNEKFVAISPATPGLTGFDSEFRTKLGDNYVDVGIAEQHAVGFASGIAKNGAKPILVIASSFLQRAYDQLSQDLAINNAPAVILVCSYGINCSDVTHSGVFDIPLISNIPNIVYLAPTSKEEYKAMLEWSVKQNKYPVAIRMPAGKIVSKGIPDKTDYSKLNKYKVEEDGSDVAIIAVGDFFELGQQVRDELKSKLNIDATLINPIYLTGVDYDLLDSLKKNHSIVITLEDGVLDGGFGEKISRYYSSSNVKVLNYGALKEFCDRVSQEKLFKKYHLTKELILKDIVEIKELSGNAPSEIISSEKEPKKVEQKTEKEKPTKEIKEEKQIKPTKETTKKK